MVNNIIGGVTAAINAEFGDEYEIYTENIEQGLKEPCFFVMPLEVVQKRYIGNRYALSVALDVHYFTKSKQENADMNAVAGRLQWLLERIALLNGDLLNGVDMYYKLVDGVLHFFVTYKMTVKYQVEPINNMEELDIGNHTKGE